MYIFCAGRSYDKVQREDELRLKKLILFDLSAEISLMRFCAKGPKITPVTLDVKKISRKTILFFLILGFSGSKKN
jgi:hypothetical protein